MKTMLFLSMLPVYIHCMQITKNPAEIIRNHILMPKEAQLQLKTFDQNVLVGFRDSEHNNLMHITIRELIKQKNATKNYKQLQNECKPLLAYLAGIGVRVNELNDNHEAPCFIAYRDEDTTDLAENFLVQELHAHPTYFSLEPEIRIFNNIVKRLWCCGCKKQKQD